MVKEDAVPGEDVDDSGVKGEAKPSGKEALKDDHFVFSGLRVDVRLRWNPSEARSQYPLLLHFSKHRQSHLCWAEEGGRRELALLRSHRRIRRVRRGASKGKELKLRRTGTKTEGSKRVRRRKTK